MDLLWKIFACLVIYILYRISKIHICIEHIETHSMLADPLTKGMILKFFHEHTAHMGIIPDSTLV